MLEFSNRWITLSLSFGLFLSQPSYSQSDYFTGAVLDSAQYEKVNKSAPLSRGDFEVPIRFSLKKYAPTPGNQGRQGSCVGWATAYAARTALEASQKSISNKSKVNEYRLSPAYVYNNVRANDQCEGSYISSALSFIQNNGVAPLSHFKYSDKSCVSIPSDSLRKVALPYRIGSYERLFNSGSMAKHVKVRQVLAKGYPVVIGMFIPEDSGFYDTKSLWVPTQLDVDNLAANRAGGHAMTVVGYDDKKYGGAFEVINSWGTNWGDGGFFWISYSSFNKFVFEGYAMYPVAPPAPKVLPVKPKVDLKASVKFIHLDGNELKLASTNSASVSKMIPSLPSGSLFRTEVHSKQASFVYILGGDSTGKFVELFPGKKGLSPQLPSFSTMLIPGPTEEYFTKLDNSVGQDVYLTLISRIPINSKSVLDKLNRERGSLDKRLKASIGDRLVIDKNIIKSNGNEFEAATLGNGVLAHVTYINHVGFDQGYRDVSKPKIVITRPTIDSVDLNGGDGLPVTVKDGLFEIQGFAQDVSSIKDIRITGLDSIRFNSKGRFIATIEANGETKKSLTIEATDEHNNVGSETFVFNLK